MYFIRAMARFIKHYHLEISTTTTEMLCFVEQKAHYFVVIQRASLCICLHIKSKAIIMNLEAKEGQ